MDLTSRAPSLIYQAGRRNFLLSLAINNCVSTIPRRKLDYSLHKPDDYLRAAWGVATASICVTREQLLTNTIGCSRGRSGHWLQFLSRSISHPASLSEKVAGQAAYYVNMLLIS